MKNYEGTYIFCFSTSCSWKSCRSLYKYKNNYTTEVINKILKDLTSWIGIHLCPIKIVTITPFLCKIPCSFENYFIKLYHFIFLFISAVYQLSGKFSFVYWWCSWIIIIFSYFKIHIEVSILSILWNAQLQRYSHPLHFKNSFLEPFLYFAFTK